MNFMEKIISIVRKHRLIIYFILCTLVVLFIGYCLNPSIDKYYYDSGLYYHLSTTFIKNGYFEFTNFDLSRRGYLFPFILFIYTTTGSLINIDPAICILIGNSLFVSFIFIFILPNLFFDAKKVHIIKILIPIILFMIYWSDLVFYPLSDVYSYGAILIAILLLQKVDFSHITKTIICGLLVGILLYASYNIRTIYMFLIPPILILFVFLRRKDNNKMLALTLIAVVVGVSISSIPQININDNNYNKKSIAVITNSLFEFQLYNGLSVQRYETYIGDPIVYPTPGIKFIDEIGSQIIEKEKISLDKDFNALLYFKLVMKYPLDFMGIMARHLVNIFHLPYIHAYIKDIDDHKIFYTIFNYTILFIAGIGFITLNRKKNNTTKPDKNMLYLLVTLIPCITILPGSIEMRFFMPMYILIYSFIAYKLPYNEAISYIRSNKIKIVISYIIILSLLAAVWGSTFNNAEFVPQLLG